jgi:hypothetical protein
VKPTKSGLIEKWNSTIGAFNIEIITVGIDLAKKCFTQKPRFGFFSFPDSISQSKITPRRAADSINNTAR